jgi:hypothetical protein
MSSETSDEGVRWLSYAELGELRGTSAASAKRFAFRKGWRRQPANDGTARVAVPVAGTVPRVTRSESVTGDQGGDRAGDQGGDHLALSLALAAVEAAHRGEVEALKGQLEALKTLADSSTTKLVDAETRTATLEAELDRVRAAHQKALETLQAMEAAESAHHARGLLARLWIAWKGW